MMPQMKAVQALKADTGITEDSTRPGRRTYKYRTIVLSIGKNLARQIDLLRRAERAVQFERLVHFGWQCP